METLSTGPYWPFVRWIHRWPVDSAHEGPVTQSFDVFFDMCLNKWLSKQSRRRWFETPSRSLWHFQLNNHPIRPPNRQVPRSPTKPVTLTLTCNLEKCYPLRSSFGMYNLERRLRYLHLLTSHCPFLHNLGCFFFHIWSQVEAVFNISKVSKWPHFELATNFFTGSDTGSWIYQKDGH